MTPDGAPARSSARLTINVPDEGLREGNSPPFAVSRDGRRIALVVDPGEGPPQLYLRSLDQFEAIPMPGTENARLPFFSPDGQRVGFWADGRLQKVAVTGGTPIEISDVPLPFRGASWGPDDTIILGGSNTGLQHVSASGGTPVALTTIDAERGETYHAWPEVMPDGRDVLFTIQRGSLV